MTEPGRGRFAGRAMIAAVVQAVVAVSAVLVGTPANAQDAPTMLDPALRCGRW